MSYGRTMSYGHAIPLIQGGGGGGGGGGNGDSADSAMTLPHRSCHCVVVWLATPLVKK